VATPTVSLVLPAYNEQHRIPPLLDVLRSTAAADLEAAGLELLEIVLVDDGSTDGTPALIEAEAARDPRLRAITLSHNRGKGGAVCAGVEAARGELSLIADVDLSTPLSEIGKLYEPLREGADIAIGSRTLDPSIVQRSTYRRLLGRAFNLLVRALTGLRHRDTQCGFKLSPTGVARGLLRGQLIERYAFDVETLMRARHAGYAVQEVPVIWIENPASPVGLHTAWRMAWDTLWLTWRLRLRSWPYAEGSSALEGLRTGDVQPPG
jgi:dolichyl-phosphate beta-glucosyltransferase